LLNFKPPDVGQENVNILQHLQSDGDVARRWR